MKMGRFIIDGHVHSQRHAAGPELRKKLAEEAKGKKLRYKDLVQVMPSIKAFDNSERLLYDMNCYDVDMCILMSWYGMNNEANLALIDKHPDRFAACAPPRRPTNAIWPERPNGPWKRRARSWTASSPPGRFVGIGEGFPAHPDVLARKKRMSQTDRLDEIMQVMEVAQKHSVPVHITRALPWATTWAYPRPSTPYGATTWPRPSPTFPSFSITGAWPAGGGSTWSTSACTWPQVTTTSTWRPASTGRTSTTRPSSIRTSAGKTDLGNGLGREHPCLQSGGT